MVKRKFDRNQAKLGINTLDWNVPENHISRFVVEFVEEVFPLLNIKEPNKKKGRDSLPVDSMLKLLIYAKIQHIDRTSIISDMARYHDIFNTCAMILGLLKDQFKDIEENMVIILKYCCK